MATSTGTCLTPYMGKGEPRVEILGKFALGPLFYSSNQVYLATRLSTWRFAQVRSGSSATFKVVRPAGLVVSRPDVKICEFSGLPQGWVGGVTEPPYADSAGAVRMFDSEYEPSVWDSESSIWSSWQRAQAAYGMLTHGSAEFVRLVVYGQLESLDLSALRSTRVIDGNIMYGYPSSSRRNYDFPSYVGGPGCGWRTYEVHIFEQPWLRGHITMPLANPRDSSSVYTPDIKWES